MDLLPVYAVIGSLDLRTLPPVMLTDRSHVRQLQVEDPVTLELLRKLENSSQSGNSQTDLLQYTALDGLLYFHDPKTKCGLHPLKQMKL